MIDYSVTSVIHLSLEYYHNAGLSPEKTKEIIEGIRDPAGNLNLYCEASGINHNWNVRTRALSPGTHGDIVNEITERINVALSDLRKNKQPKA